MKKCRFLLLNLLLISLIACTEDPLPLGEQLIDANITLHTKSYSGLVAYSIELSPVQATNNNTEQCVLGHYNESIAGNRKAEILTEFISTDTSYKDQSIDSAVLYIAYDTQLGDDDVVPLVYLTQDSLDIETSDFDMGQVSKEQLNDLPTMRNTKDKQQLALPLDIASIQSHLDQRTLPLFFAYSGTKEVGKGSLYVLNLFSSDTYLAVYYRTSTGTDTLHYKITTSSKRYSFFTNDYKESRVGQSINDTLSIDTVAYIQGMAGPGMQLHIPQVIIDSLATLKIINKATLRLPLHPDSPEGAIPFVMTKGRFSNGDEIPIRDSPYHTDISYSGGQLSNNQYQLNISMHLRSILDQQATNILFIFPVNQNNGLYDLTTPFTSIIDIENISLDIIYTKND